MFLNHSAAFDYVKRLLAKNYSLKSLTALNRGRHLLIQVEKDSVRNYFYCVFKHTPLHSFNSLAKDFVDKHPDLEGFGESINVESLVYARRFDATFLYIYPDGKVYSIPSVTVFNVVHEHQLTREQDRNNEYRELYGNGAIQVIRERTAIFPLKLMARWY